MTVVEPAHRNTAGARVTRSKIDDLLSERHRRFTPLQKLLRRAATQDSWTAQLQALLPDPLSRDCRVIDVRGPTVVVVCKNASSATRLRFMTDDLLAELKQLADFRAARTVQIRVSAT
jgi:hypothetical protein